MPCACHASPLYLKMPGWTFNKSILIRCAFGCWASEMPREILQAHPKVMENVNSLPLIKTNDWLC